MFQEENQTVSKEKLLQMKKTVHLEGVEEAEQEQVGWRGGGRECQGRTIFWLTSLELELPRGITAPDLSAVPSFFTFCNTIVLEPSLLHSLLDKKSFQAFQTDSGSESLFPL